MNRIRWRKTALLLIFIILTCVSLSGCRESHVLEQKVYTQDQPVDYENDVDEINNDEDNTEEDEEISSLAEQDESRMEREQQDVRAVRGPGSSRDTTAKLQYDQGSQQSGETTGAGGGEGDSTQTVPAGTTDKPGINPTGEEEQREVVDPNGEVVDPPENLSLVTAVGETAALVEMLGGKGRLAASSESFTGNYWAQTVFQEDMANIQTLWSGKGSEALSGDAFQALLALQPAACIVNSGDYTFTDDQLAQLAASGIETVTLPKLNNLENIESTVRLLGQILGDQSAGGGTNAPAIAEEYCKWAEGIIQKVDNAVDSFNYGGIDFSKDRYALRQDTYTDTETETGLYTLFISDWDGSASYRLFSGSYQTLAGNGVAIAPSGYSTTPLSYYLSEAGVVNTAAVAPDSFSLKYWYVNPLDPSTRVMDIQGAAGTVTNRFLTVINDQTSDGTTGSRVYLGEERFPAIVAASQAVRSAIESNKASGSMWTPYPVETSSDGKVSGYGFREEQGQIVSTTIHGDYSIYVLPDGVGSWNYGSAEGVMASMWAASKFCGAFQEQDLKQEIADFYSAFYGYSLNDGQLSQILAGK